MRNRSSISPEKMSWKNMRARCLNPRQINYHNYGGRGIRICERWNSFKAFLEDMGPKPTPQHTIDRIDSNGNYEPGNCRWADKRTQRLNSRLHVNRLTFRGETHTFAEWAEITGLTLHTIENRFYRRLPVHRILSDRPQRHRHIPENVKAEAVALWRTGMALNAVARRFGIDRASIRGYAERCPVSHRKAS